VVVGIRKVDPASAVGYAQANESEVIEVARKQLPDQEPK
jgi:hypothetical protein